MLNLAFLFAAQGPADPPASGRPGRSSDAGKPVTGKPVQDPADASEMALVRRVRSGDDEALAEIFYAYAPALAEFAERYVRDAAVAEELVQDTFLWIVRNRAMWSVRGTIRAYLYGAVRNYALDHLRHVHVEQRWVETSNRDDDVVPDDSDRLVADERAAKLALAIAQLAESRRAALTLRWVQGLSYAEIATVLGSSTKAVENQLNRTLRQLRELLGE